MNDLDKVVPVAKGSGSAIGRIRPSSRNKEPKLKSSRRMQPDTTREDAILEEEEESADMLSIMSSDDVDTDDSDASSISILIGHSSKKRRKSWFRNNNKVANDQDKSGKEDSKCDVKKKKKAEEDDDSIPVHLLVSQTNDTQKWKEKLALKELVTDAYGYIKFEDSNNQPSPFIRISFDSDQKHVKELITNHWKMTTPRPHLALSIVGGAKNFKMEGRKKQVFKEGLILAARSTHAWILSGGTNTGSMKLVGETVKEGQFLVQDGTGLTTGMKALGIAPWGYIHSRSTLVVKECDFRNLDEHELSNRTYNSNIKVERGKCPPLDPNHTHFLLVDDGYRNRYYGGRGISQFVKDFQIMLSSPRPSGLGVPVITLLLEGGTDAIKEPDKL